MINLAASLQNDALMHQTFDHYDSTEMQRSLNQNRERLEALAQCDGRWAESTLRSHILAGRSTLLDTSTSTLPLHRTRRCTPEPIG